MHVSNRRISRFLYATMGLLDVLWYVWKCWQVIRRSKPDVVHLLLTGVYLALPALLLNWRTRCVMSAYSYQFEPHRDKRILANMGAAIKRLGMGRCQVIDALTSLIGDDLISRGVDGRKIMIAPCSFTDLSLCQPSWPKKKWVVFLARFIDIKNPLLLAQAIPQVVAQEPDVHFFFLGEGDLGPQLALTVQDLDVSDYVTVRFEPCPAQILNLSSIFMSLQSAENYPSQSLLEAMACANAIVATDVGETWRLVDEANGIRIPPTVDAVADAILTLLRDPLLHQRGIASRQRVLKEHTRERFFAHMRGVYRTASNARQVERL